MIMIICTLLQTACVLMLAVYNDRVVKEYKKVCAELYKTRMELYDTQARLAALQFALHKKGNSELVVFSYGKN